MIAMQSIKKSTYQCDECMNETGSVVALGESDISELVICFGCWLKMADLIREKKNDRDC